MPRGSPRCGRKKYSSHHALNRSYDATAGVALAGGAQAVVKEQRVGVVGAAARVQHRRQVGAAAEPRLAGDDEARVHVHGRDVRVPRMGDRPTGRRPRSADRRRRRGSAWRTPARRRRRRSRRGRPSSRTGGRAASPSARRRPARRSVGAAPRLDDEAARRRARRSRGHSSSSASIAAISRSCSASNQAWRARWRSSSVSIARSAPSLQPAARTRATSRSTWAIGVSGRMPWPRLKIWARPAKPSSTRSTPSSSARPPATSASGSRLPCSASRAGSAAAAARGLGRRVEADRREAVDAGELAELGRRAARKGDDRRRGQRGAELGDHARDRRDAPALEFGRRQHARPGIEDLRRLGAGAELAHEIGGRGLDQPVDQRREQVGMAIGEQARRRLIGRAAAGDHVARHRPRRAAEADQRDLVAAARLDARDGLEHRREPRPVGLVAQRGEIGGGLDRLEARPFALLEADALAERVGDDENVGEQDRRVEAETADRLQRRLGRQRRRVAEVEERRRLGAHRAVFGQIAAGLAHQPHRRSLAGGRRRGRRGAASSARGGARRRSSIP